MEITVNTIEQPKQFKTFSITITVETEREALMLQALTNNNSALQNFINDSNMSSCPHDYGSEEVNNFGNLWSRVATGLAQQIT